jgi:hypothetical protein
MGCLIRVAKPKKSRECSGYMRICEAVVVECNFQLSAPGSFYNGAMGGCDAAVSDYVSIGKKSLSRRRFEGTFCDNNGKLETVARAHVMKR